MNFFGQCESQGKEGTFDFAFVNANKDGYLQYHELLLKLFKIGGVIGYDNTLWCGMVALSENDEIEDFMRGDKDHIMKVKTFLAADSCIEPSLLFIGDGLTICRHLN